MIFQLNLSRSNVFRPDIEWILMENEVLSLAILISWLQNVSPSINQHSGGCWTDGWLARTRDPLQPEIRRMSRFVDQRIWTSSWSLAGEDPELWRANRRFRSLRNHVLLDSGASGSVSAWSGGSGLEKPLIFEGNPSGKRIRETQEAAKGLGIPPKGFLTSSTSCYPLASFASAKSIRNDDFAMVFSDRKLFSKISAP